jgi:hypothetical protein
MNSGRFGQRVALRRRFIQRGRLGFLVERRRAGLVREDGLERLTLLTGDLTGVGAPQALQLLVVAYGLVEQSQAARKPYCPGASTFYH